LTLRKIREVIIVEGRYDKNTVAQVVDGTIIETSGFSVFSNKEKLALLTRLAEKRGLIILTDSDGAGFFIRGRLRGILGDLNIKHAFIPDVTGRERRKSQSSKDGLVGVEGMRPDVILSALERAGVTFIDGEKTDENSLSIPQERETSSASSAVSDRITKTDMYDLGLSGRSGSSGKRAELIKRLDLPSRMSANSLLDILNVLYTRDEFFTFFNSPACK